MAAQIGTCDLRLQQHFSFIKRIPLQTMNSIALRSNAFDQTQFDNTSRQPDNVHQQDNFLKTLIRKGHDICYQFLQELARSGFEEEVDICLSEHNDDVNVNDQPNNVTSEIIAHNVDYIASNLEIGTVLDMLFERQIITINEHDEVQEKRTKPEKRRLLLSLLLSRPNTNWLFGFIRVLKNTGHINLLERVRQHVSNCQELAEPECIQLGQTRLLPNDFIARLSSNSIQREESDVITLHTAPVQQVVQEVLDSYVIDIWEGSIYFYLSTFSPDTILAILNGKGDKKLMLFLQLLFSRNKYLLLQFPKDTVVQLELEEKPEDIFIDTFYGRRKSQIPTNKDEFCSGCCQATLRAKYKTVLDEIEDDIIQDTLTRLNIAATLNPQLYASQVCLLGNKTRSEKAFTFLQYVLGNEHVLSEFSKAFAYHSQVKLERVKCRNCSLSEGTLIPLDTRKRVFHFTISMDDFGQIEIMNIHSALITPSAVFRPLDDRPNTCLRKLTEHSGTDGTDKYRIVVIETEETEYARELQLLTEHQLHLCKIPHFGLTPVTWESLRGVKDCISSARPGPHAFLFATDLYDPSSLMTFFKTCDEYFGPDFMQFIIPIFTTNSKPDEHSVFEVEHAVEHLFPKLRSFKPHEHRFIIFENNAARIEKVIQIDKLTKLIAKMQMVNNGTNKYYRNESFEKSEKAIQKKDKVDQKITQSKHPEISTPEDVFSQADNLGIP